MTTLLAILILVGFTVGMCYLVGDENLRGVRGATFFKKLTSGGTWIIQIILVVVGAIIGFCGVIIMVIWAIKELIGG